MRVLGYLSDEFTLLICSDISQMHQPPSHNFTWCKAYETYQLACIQYSLLSGQILSASTNRYCLIVTYVTHWDALFEFNVISFNLRSGGQ